jgi:protein TonB
VFVIASTLFLGENLSWSQSSEEAIETLEVIEIPGTAVIVEKRQLIFPKPNIYDYPPPPASDTLRISAEFPINHNFTTTSVALDPIGKQRGITSKPLPVKIDSPPYPRIAKEQGWQGTVKLTLTIGPDGKVSSSTIHTSSGFPILDHIAIEATDDWLFQPEKDGEFPVATKVNVPVKFNLHEKK